MFECCCTSGQIISNVDCEKWCLKHRFWIELQSLKIDSKVFEVRRTLFNWRVNAVETPGQIRDANLECGTRSNTQVI